MKACSSVLAKAAPLKRTLVISSVVSCFFIAVTVCGVCEWTSGYRSQPLRSPRRFPRMRQAVGVPQQRVKDLKPCQCLRKGKRRTLSSTSLREGGQRFLGLGRRYTGLVKSQRDRVKVKVKHQLSRILQIKLQK